jgi:methyl-accepting chemotaxis protein
MGELGHSRTGTTKVDQHPEDFCAKHGFMQGNSGSASADNPQDLVRDWANHLKSLNEATERDFLNLGSALENISREAKNISQIVEEVVEHVGGQKATDDMMKLRALIDVMEKHFKQSHSRTELAHDPLRRMADAVKAAHTPLSVFPRIVKHLRMLGISTKIENARLAGGNGTFDTLAEKVEELSTTVAAKSEGILKGTASLLTISDEATRTIAACQASMGQETDAMLHRLTEGLSILSERYSMAAGTASSLADRSRQVSEDISEIIQSLQLHDITRQQIEHVVEALYDAGKGGSHNDETMDRLRRTGKLHLGQLDSAKNGLVAAIEAVVTAFGKISSCLSQVSNDTASLIGFAGEGHTSFLFELNGLLSSVVTSFIAHEETGTEVFEALSSVAAMIEELSLSVGDVEEIGSEIALIALNAQVRAAKNVKDGGALNVLAEAVRSLSDNTGSQTKIIAGALNKARDLAEELNRTRQGGDFSAAGSIEAQTRETRDVLTASHDDLTSSLHGLDTGLKALAASVDMGVRGLTAHARANEVIGGVVEGLQKLLAEGKDRNGHGDDTSDSYLDDIADRYTMHRERHIHQAYVGSEFGSTSVEKQGDFDGSVELF